MTHLCSDCGLEHEAAAVVPEPAPVVVDSGPNENDVKIAEIEAATEVAIQEAVTERAAFDAQTEIESLRGELRGMREVLDRMAPPEPEPEPVVIPVDVPGPPGEPAEPAPGPPEGGPPKTGKKPSGYWG